MLDWIGSFTVLIQTITAVNFIYILTHYPKRLFKLFFNDKRVDRLYERDNNEISADIESLSSIDLEGIFKDAAQPKENRDTLLEDYLNLRTKWGQLIKGFKSYIENAGKVKGSKCLFLAISLFCIVTLFNASLVDLSSNTQLSPFWLSFIASFNLLTLAYTLYLTIIIFIDGWHNRDADVCYRRTITWFIIIVVLSLVFACINNKCSFFTFRQSANSIATYIYYLSAILPFYPCFVCFLYVVIKLLIFRFKARRNSLDLLIERRKLHTQKEKFDNIKDLCKGPNIKFK